MAFRARQIGIVETRGGRVMEAKALEARRAYQRKWREKNKERLKAYQKQYRETHKEQLKQNSINFYNRLAEEQNNEA